MLYEERRIRLRSGAFPDYRRWVHSTLWPALEAAGHAPLCLLNGLIGAAVEDVVLIVSAAAARCRASRPDAPPSRPNRLPRRWASPTLRPAWLRSRCWLARARTPPPRGA